MHPLKSLFIVSVLLSALATADEQNNEPAADQPVDTKAVLERLSKLPPADQQAWLRRIEERATRAARLAFKPGEASRQQSKVRNLLHQKTVTWRALAEVIEDTDAHEKAVIDQLSHKYRTLVFESFYRQIDVYGDYQAAWRDVQSDWQRAGQPFDYQDRMIDWLEKAIRNATPATLGPVPEKPTFQTETAQEKKSEEPKTQEKPSPEPKKQAAADKSPAPAVEIKTDELAARIAGWNLAFRALEIDLDEDGAWNAAKIEPILERLAILIVRRNDLSMFSEAVPAERRDSLEKLSSTKIAFTQLATRIEEARKFASGKNFKGSAEDQKTELRRLDEIAKRAKETAAK